MDVNNNVNYLLYQNLRETTETAGILCGCIWSRLSNLKMKEAKISVIYIKCIQNPYTVSGLAEKFVSFNP